VEAPAETDALWTLGTLVIIKLTGAETGGRLSVWEHVFPKGASPPLHSHPQDETFYVVEGCLTIWLGEAVSEARAGDVVCAPAGTPHTYIVESEGARVLMISTPAGIEDFLRAVGQPAEALTLPPSDLPRDEEAVRAAERAAGIVVHGPRPKPPG
jgi:quercetin dioxygenase-like cupin family protein